MTTNKETKTKPEREKKIEAMLKLGSNKIYCGNRVPKKLGKTAMGTIKELLESESYKNEPIRPTYYFRDDPNHTSSKKYEELLK